MVTDLQRLSEALSKDTPEKIAERELRESQEEIATALKTTGVYEDRKLGLRISADNGHSGR